MGEPTPGGGNAGAGQFPALGLGMDPFTSSAAGGDQMFGGTPDSSGGFGSYDDPSNVIGDPFFDPVFGSEMMGGGQEGFPGQTPYVKDPDQKQEGGADPQQQGGQQEQIPDAAGGPRQRPQPQGPFGGLSPLLKQLASAVTGGQPQGPSFIKPAATAAGRLSSFLSGQPQKPQGQQGQGQDQKAPQGTEGGGAPAVSPPTQVAPPPTDQGQTMSPRPPIGAAFPTTLSHLAQAAPGPTDAGPTPPQAAAPDTGAGAGAAPGQAAPGAAPDPQLQAITGSPQQSLQNLLEGRTNLTQPQQVAPQPQAQPQQTGEFTAPTQQVVAQSRLAGTDTAPTAGFSPYLAQERSPYVKELDNPRTALRMAAMMSFEHENDPVAVAESLMNRTKYSNSTLDNMLSPRFYGPMRKPRMFQRRMAELQRNPQRMQKLINAAKTAGQGTNLLGGATDQGSGRDPNVNHRGGRVIRHGEIYNDWGGGPGGHAGAQRFRQEQQQRVRSGGGGQQEAKMAPRDPSMPFRELEGQRKKRETRLAMNETTGQAPPQPQRVDPNAAGDIGTGAGTLPQPQYIDAIQRMHEQRKRNQGIAPRGDLLDWLVRQATA